MSWDTLWLHANIATMAPGGAKYGAIENGAIAAQDGRIVWVGSFEDLPGAQDGLAAQVHDAQGRWITPGLIDCHTHLVYGGNRAHEFEMRLEGATYEEIARAGGGIVSTVRATRAASEDALADAAGRRVACLATEGVTTIEIKSGYGLDRDTECKQLRVIRKLAASSGLTVRSTFLGAHAVPPEFHGRSNDYIDFVCADVLPPLAAAGLIDAVDGFCETIGFTAHQIERLFAQARALDLPVKLHADQLSDGQGAALAAKYSALSADHLEYTDESGVSTMSAAGTVAVLLPGAFYFLRERKLPPIDLFRRFGVPMAIATDSNPGSSPILSLLLTTNFACTLFGLTVEEALLGVTRHGAQALGLGASHGTLEVGKVADFVFWDVSPAELVYQVGANPCAGIVIGGRLST